MKQEIFDRYAKSKGFEDWVQLVNVSFANEVTKHVYAACDLVQEEQQKRIAENAKMTVKTEHGEFEAVGFASGDQCAWIDKDSILNPENLIK